MACAIPEITRAIEVPTAPNAIRERRRLGRRASPGTARLEAPAHAQAPRLDSRRGGASAHAVDQTRPAATTDVDGSPPTLDADVTREPRRGRPAPPAACGSSSPDASLRHGARPSRRRARCARAASRGSSSDTRATMPSRRSPPRRRRTREAMPQGCSPVAIRAVSGGRAREKRSTRARGAPGCYPRPTAKAHTGRSGRPRRRAAPRARRSATACTARRSSARDAREVGGRVHLKAELFQRTGSFKPRGVLNKLATLIAGGEGARRDRASPPATTRRRSPTARALEGIDALVVMWQGASEQKIAATRGVRRRRSTSRRRPGRGVRPARRAARGDGPRRSSTRSTTRS